MDLLWYLSIRHKKGNDTNFKIRLGIFNELLNATNLREFSDIIFKNLAVLGSGRCHEILVYLVPGIASMEQINKMQTRCREFISKQQ